MGHNLDEDWLDSNVVGNKMEVLYAVESSFFHYNTSIVPHVKRNTNLLRKHC